MNGIQKFYIVLLLFTLSVMGLLAVVATQVEGSAMKYGLVGMLVVIYLSVTFFYFFRKGGTISMMHGLGMGADSFKYYSALFKQKDPTVLLDETSEFKSTARRLEGSGRNSIDEIALELQKPSKQIKRISKFASYNVNPLQEESRDIFKHVKNNGTFIQVTIGLLVVLVVGGGAAAVGIKK